MKNADKPSMQVFEQLESEVRSYCRSFTTVFSKATGAKMWDANSNEYIDFFAGAGSLNYGHNNPAIRRKIVDYMLEDGITHSLDMATKAKESFLTTFDETILEPRNLTYKVMFPGPTGTNSVESALKIARKVTGRNTVISFTNAFHGMTLGSLAATGNGYKRAGAGVALGGTAFMPYDGYFGDNVNTVEYLAKMLEDPGSGVETPAAVILETVQGEGGLNVASRQWLQDIEKLCRKHDILLIVDDVQMGCGRTGTFFSFEEAGIKPDIVCLSKSIGGYGLPLALTLISPKYDIWKPGEHNGTFRGNNLGFVAAEAALAYWKDDSFTRDIKGKADAIRSTLNRLIEKMPEGSVKHKGKGMIQGLSFTEPEMASKLCGLAFERGLIMETSGPFDEVAKLMPPLTIEPAVLEAGLKILEGCVDKLAAKEELVGAGQA
ncbi:diaminobutyrate--2-oxoglutarate transaminase [Paenibacillus sambharensis]|uniref:Diaminobutyrate--2-oxoglutarate transaminase n=1 Tax=Paenibacillus sambharensis TaxID=1803190 RepID=A0A2W1LRE3_9BACL|nr:diaminobutyrate--2-oxoglutarate transaminase [Paenibacillus sambharensis]PZD94391.1 diaminobutyrate--2-oxoglutarate transaminase [Paenibacillus sambharensis]